MTKIATKRLIPRMTGMSRSPRSLIRRSPNPGKTKMVSRTTDPEITSDICTPMIVIIGIRAFFITWRLITVNFRKPLEEAVRT